MQRKEPTTKEACDIPGANGPGCSQRQGRGSVPNTSITPYPVPSHPRKANGVGGKSGFSFTDREGEPDRPSG